jgi:hypothetical protein
MKYINQLINSLLVKSGYQVIKSSTLEKILSEREQINRQQFFWRNQAENIKEGISDKNLERFHKINFHDPVNGMPELILAQTITKDNDKRVKIAERILGSYNKAISDEKKINFPKPEDDLWTALKNTELADLLEILEGQNPEKLAVYLMDFGKKVTWFGGLSYSLDGYNQIKTSEHIAFSYFDKLICLAEALGIIAIEHPEHGRWGENIYYDINEITEKIEKELGIAIVPPQNVISVYGLKTEKGIFNYRHINSLYTAFRIKKILSEDEARICEYGGGLGTVAFYLAKMGITDYTIFDLPLINIFAAHLLLNSLSPEAVVLYGEEPKENAIKLFPYWACEKSPDKYFDLTVNQDSFPEIDENTVKKYFKEIERTTKKYFLSINQESEGSLTAEEDSKKLLNIPLMLKGNSGFERFYRFPYWIRKGYIEELYKIK